MIRMQWVMEPFPGMNDEAIDNVKKFAKLWKDQGANTSSVAMMTGSLWGHISLSCTFDNYEHSGKVRDLVRGHKDLKNMINAGSNLGEIVQENTYSIVEHNE